VLNSAIWCLTPIYPDKTQEPPILDLVNECSRFVTGFFNIISASAPHIYHSALVLTPKTSIVRKLYEAHVHPFVRVVHGALSSWDPNTAIITCPSSIEVAVWSQCSNFIAIVQYHPLMVDILDSATHQRLQTLESPQGTSTFCRAFVFSPDSRMLTCSSGGEDYDRQELSVISWDLQTGGIVSVIKRQGFGMGMECNPSIVYSTNGILVAVCYWYTDTTVISIHDVVSGVHIHSHSLDSPVWNGKPFPWGGSTPDDGSVLDGRSVSDNSLASDSSLVSNNLTPNFNGSVSNNGPVHQVSSTGKILKNIWIHGDSLRFATLGPTTITIWEVGFASGTTPTEVETLFVPDDARFAMPCYLKRVDQTEHVQFLPTSSRLAMFCWHNVLVWDARNSKSLLYQMDTRRVPGISFSSDGRFFTCKTTGDEFYLWKESPTGYVLHGTFVHRTESRNLVLDGESFMCVTERQSLLLSPNGESIVTFGGHTVRLWDTNSFTAPPSTQTLRHTGDFILDFSPDRTLAVVARREDSVVTVLDLKSGDLRLAIDMGMGIYGLRAIEDSVVIVGDGKVITWDLPAGDRIPNARVNFDDSTRAITLSSPIGRGAMLTASISSDRDHVALVRDDSGYCFPRRLYIYSASTGEHLGSWDGSEADGNALSFTPDGRGVWCVGSTGEAEVWTVTEHGPTKLPGAPRVDIEHPPEGYPWGSSHGYRATDDGWVLGPDRKRLLMLPPPWQSSSALHRVWNGRFLALLHGALPEPVILELDL